MLCHAIRLSGFVILALSLSANWTLLRGQSSPSEKPATETPPTTTEPPKPDQASNATDKKRTPAEPATALFAGGCFWCLESDFQHCPGVVEVVSGYTGGRTPFPSYDNYENGGHREAILVYYDPSRVTYDGLIEYLIKHIDPFDQAGSFIDRGKHYSSAIYAANEKEKRAATDVMKAIDELKVFRKTLNVPVLDRGEFYPAEEYHQNFAVAQPAKYSKYRATCGRDPFLVEMWGEHLHHWLLPTSVPQNPPQTGQPPADSNERSKATMADGEPAKSSETPWERPWEKFIKPKPSVLKKQLTKLQFRVTQGADTETAFANSLWNHHEEGIYVDVVSGEPLFASYDKFDSGTGWPSFVAPLFNEYIETHNDFSEGAPRIEVRSKYGQSHLGHVFTDGPPQRGGLRFCINSAALRFIPKEKMEEEGYSEFLSRFR